MLPKLLVPIVVASFCVAACSGAQARRNSASRSLAAGDHEFSMRHAGRTRSYIVHVPPQMTSRPAIVIAFHGGGGNASGFQEYAELDAIADRERFLVVYPNGTGPLPRRLLTWNAGDGCCGYAVQRNVDDVGFAVALIDDLERRTPLDRRRIYATGHSNGGIMSHRLAAERPDLVAAVAPVAGSLDLEQFAPTRAVAVLQIHSVDDPRALYAGGLGPPFPGTNNRVVHQGVPAGLHRWIAANGCRPRPDTLDVRRGAQGTGEASHTATRLVWRSCRDGVVVEHWKLTGSGHAWPGDAPPPGSEAISGPQTTIVRAAQEVWAFLSRFSR
ncbi:MAG: extracellular catalytic domain type 1 short-chain-length polyhydroxyalkanoate depolymerase [Gemmatimonadaceae bacterium]